MSRLHYARKKLRVKLEPYVDAGLDVTVDNTGNE